MLQHTATHCNTTHHTATHYNALQHTQYHPYICITYAPTPYTTLVTPMYAARKYLVVHHTGLHPYSRRSCAPTAYTTLSMEPCIRLHIRLLSSLCVQRIYGVVHHTGLHPFSLYIIYIYIDIRCLVYDIRGIWYTTLAKPNEQVLQRRQLVLWLCVSKETKREKERKWVSERERTLYIHVFLTGAYIHMYVSIYIYMHVYAYVYIM